MQPNQIIQFSVPRFYDDVSIRIGGNSYQQLPFVSIGQTVIPFVPADFSSVDRRTTTDTLATFFGIDDNSPAPPTLNGTGRGRNLLDAGRLATLHAELTGIYGYPGWLNLSLKDWIRYEMNKENARWIALNQNTSDLQTALSTWAANYTSNQAAFRRIKYSIMGFSDIDTKTQLNTSFFYFDTLPDGAEYRKYIVPSIYLDVTSPNDKALDVILPKAYKIKDLQYFNITVVGDRNIDLTAFNAIKNTNDLNVDFYCEAPAAGLPYARYPLFDPEPNLDYTASGGITFICTYDDLEKGETYIEPVISPVKMFSLAKEEKNIEKDNETEELKEVSTPANTIKTEIKLSPILLISILLFLFLLIILQKASK